MFNPYALSESIAKHADHAAISAIGLELIAALDAAADVSTNDFALHAHRFVSIDEPGAAVVLTPREVVESLDGFEIALLRRGRAETAAEDFADDEGNHERMAAALGDVATNALVELAFSALAEIPLAVFRFGEHEAELSVKHTADA